MKKRERLFLTLFGLLEHDELAGELPVKLVQAVFESAYLLGRKDTIDGLYIDPNLAYEQFKQCQQEQANALTDCAGGREGVIH